MATITNLALKDHPELGPDPLGSRLSQAFKSARLRYRGVERDDADADLLYRLKVDPDAALNASAGWPRPYTRDAAREFAKVLETNLLSVIVELDPAEVQPREDGSGGGGPAQAPGAGPPKAIPIGMLSLRGCFASDASPSRIAELGVDILAPYQGRGYGSEATRWILDWAFDMAGLHRVRLQCFSWNTRAIRAYEAVGFQRTGTESESVWCMGRWWDLLTYGILDRDWQRIKEERSAKVALSSTSG